MSLQGLPLRRGDRFVETYYFNRWYNIYAIHSRLDGSLSGWYCNITRPAELVGEILSYIDLALDLVVFPDGNQVVLDEDEFAALPLTPDECQTARQALAELQSLFESGEV
jgi:protein associated with RNAse G/E